MTPAASMNVTSNPGENMTEHDRLAERSHMLDVTVWLLIFSIFTFFFIIIVSTLCMQWFERRREGLRGESLLLPTGPVPGYFTVLLGNQPHLRLVGHYQVQPCDYGGTTDMKPVSPARSFSSPHLTREYDDVTNYKK